MNAPSAAEPTLTFEPFDLPAENEILTDFLVSETWPFHSGSTLSREEVARRIADGAFGGDDKRCFWIMADGERVGTIKLFDLDDIPDGYPLFDLRLRAACRGKGIGLRALQWLTRYLFETWPELTRIEGTTRADNIAMRKTFMRGGYAKEGYYRKAWDGHGSVHYGILREDWESGTVTPVPWDDDANF